MADNDSRDKQSYVVLAPLVQLKVKDPAGAWMFRHYYAGSIIDPDEVEVDADNLQAHVDAGQLVEPDHDVAKTFAVPAGTPLPGKPPNVAPGESGDAANAGQPVVPLSEGLLKAAEIDAPGDAPWAATVAGGDGGGGAARPHGNARVDEWRAYHVRQRVAEGASEDEARAEANGLDRDELRARYR